MSVYIDGATVSSLLFSNLNSNGIQCGFLIGERIEQIEDRISDSQIHTSDVNYYIYVSSFIQWPSHDYICSRGGHIKNEVLDPMLTDIEQHVVGWYSFRHNSSCRPSLKEITLHNNLAMIKKFGGQPEDFLFFLCTSTCSSNMSTYTCNHGFMHISNGNFVKVPMTVMNLGDTTRKEYRKRSSATLSHNKTIQGSLLSFQKDFLKSTGEVEQIVKVNNLTSSINKALMSVHSKVAKSEVDLHALECDVNGLRKRVEKFEQEEMTQVFEMEAEHRRQEEEERKREDANVEAEEQAELDKLLIDLGISCEDMDDDAEEPAQPVSLHGADQSPESFQFIDPAPSLPLESYVYVSSVDSNPETAASVNPTATQTHSKDLRSRLENSVSGTKDSTQGSKKEQNVKVKSSDPFAFIDEELKLKKTTDDSRQRLTRANVNKNPGVNKMSNQGDSGKLASNSHERNKTSKANTFRPEMQNKRQKLVKDDETLKESATDSINGTRGRDNNVGTQDADIPADQSLNLPEESYTMSSSPVF